MKILEAKRMAILHEMHRGTGGDKIYPYPIAIEPPFSTFSHRADFALHSKNIASEPQRFVTAGSGQGDLAFVRVRPSKEDKRLPELEEQLLLSLTPVYPLSFEIIGYRGKIALQIAANRTDISGIMALISSLYTNAEVFESEDLFKQASQDSLIVRSYRLRESHFFPLRTGFKVDPYGSLFAILSSLDQDEFAALQVLLILTKNNWNGNIFTAIRNESDPAKPVFYDIPNLLKLAYEKTKTLLYAVSARVISSSDTAIDRLDGFWRQFDSENGFIGLREAYPRCSAIQRTAYSTGIILSTKELVGLAHMPSPEVLSSATEQAGRGTAPPNIAVSNALVPLGINRYRGLETPVGISEESLTRHEVIIGQSGQGKSTLILHQLASLAKAGYGFGFLDPSGDAARQLLDIIPEHRISDTILFNPADGAHPPAFNVLESADERERQLLCSDLLASFENYYRDAWGPRMAMILRNDINLLLHSPGEKTLMDVMRVLLDKEYRETLLASVDDPHIYNFWRGIYPNLPKGAGESILNKLSEFLDNPLVRNVVTQPNLIDVNRIMGENKIFIASLCKGLLGEDAANLLGSFLLAKLRIATMARANLQPQQRRLWTLVIDEVQNYASTRANSIIITTFLSEARKYRVGLILATQFLSQLHPGAVAAIFGNVGNLIAFRCGLPDAQSLRKELGDFDIDDILNLKVGECLVRMGTAGSSFNANVPPPRVVTISPAEEIILTSSNKYCRPRQVVEQALQDSLVSTTVEDTVDDENLSAEELRFLEYVWRNPDQPTTAIYNSLSLSNYSGNKIKQSLLQRELLCEVRTKLGRGARIAKFLIPSQLACQKMGLQPYHGRGGLVHQYLQSFVRQQAEANGYQVKVEYRIPGFDESIDVVIERDGDVKAIEIAVSSTADRELRNITKCLAAGYEGVINLFVDASLMDETYIQASSSLTEDEIAKVKFGLVNDLNRFL